MPSTCPSKFAEYCCGYWSTRMKQDAWPGALFPDFNTDHHFLSSSLPSRSRFFLITVIAGVIKVLCEGFRRTPSFSLGIQAAGSLTVGMQHWLEDDLHPTRLISETYGLTQLTPSIPLFRQVRQGGGTGSFFKGRCHRLQEQGFGDIF